MINQVLNVAFNGIYNVKFPKGTSQAKIQEKVKVAENFLKNVYQDNNGFIVHAFDNSMRIVTSTDNPWLLVNLFKAIGGEDLSQKYVMKAAVDLNISI